MNKIITNHSFLFVLGMAAGFLDMGSRHFFELTLWMIPFVLYGIVSSGSQKSKAAVLAFSAGALITVSVTSAFFPYMSAFRAVLACIAPLAAYCTGIVFRGGFLRSLIYGFLSMTGTIFLEDGASAVGAGILIALAIEMMRIAGTLDPEGSTEVLSGLLSEKTADLFRR